MAATVLLAYSLVAGMAWAQDEDVGCRALRRVDVHDYRSRDANPGMRWAYDDNYANHTGPALSEISKGNYTRPVMADLSFTLAHWPNHHLALQALIRYLLAGGKLYEFEPIQCYFQRARQFAPDDIDVLLARAYYQWRSGDKAGAESSYKEALEVNPSSSDAHYNLGLFYFEQRDFKLAEEHAKAAYSNGYPLGGLRKKLQAAGHWSESGPL